MQNFELLKEVGSVNKPVLLKRGLAATIDEFIHAAEYIISKVMIKLFFVNVVSVHMKKQLVIRLIFLLFRF